MSERIKPPVYHAGLQGVEERVAWEITQSKLGVSQKINEVKTDLAVKIVSSPYIRGRFSELTRGRFFPESGALQRIHESKKRGKKIVLLVNHASIAMGMSAIEAAYQVTSYLNQDSEINMTGADMTLAESIDNGEQGPVSKAAYDSAMRYANEHNVEAIQIVRKGEYGKSEGKGSKDRSVTKEERRKLQKILDRDRILIIFAEGTVESGRFASELVEKQTIDDKGQKKHEWIEQMTHRRKGLQEIGKSGKVDPNYLFKLLNRIIKDYAASWLNADGEIELLDPVTRRPHFKAVAAAVGLWSNKFIRIKMTPPITNEKVAEDLGDLDPRKEMTLVDIKQFNNYLQSAGAQRVSYEKQGDFQEVMEI